MSRLPLLLALALASNGCSGGGKKPRGQLAELTPAKIEPTPTGGDTEPFRVRIYADDAYRAQRINWERDASGLLSRANKVLGPTAGIELTLVASQSWTRKSSSKDMDAMLSELEDVDPGGDVHLIIGMVDALPDVTTSIHQLGVARPLGKHLIIRGLNDAKEVAVLEAARTGYQVKRRNQLYAERGRHKMTVVFLHEVAHVLGGVHVNLEGDILYPSYSQQQKEFSRPNATLMRLATSFRLKAEAGESRSGEFDALLAHIKGTSYPAWKNSNLDQLIEYLELRKKQEGTPQTELSALGRAVRADHRKSYREALRLAEAGKSLEAWEKAEPLFDFYPDEPAVAVLGCRLASSKGLADVEVKKRCERAAELAPDDLTPTLKIAMSAARGDDRSAAIAALDRARTRLLALPGDHAAAWQQLADGYQHLGLVSMAQDAASHGASSSAAGVWAAQQRAKYSVPAFDDAATRAKKFPPTLDGDYISDLQAILKQVYARNFGEAEKLARAAAAKYGPVAGIDTARCDLEIRRRNYSRALAHCKLAHKKYADGAWTNYLLGLLHKQGKREKLAIAHLRRSIELDRTQKHAYEILSALYVATGQTAERDALHEAYKQQFNTPL